MTWEIVAGIILLSGFLMSIGKLVANNTEALTEVKCGIAELKDALTETKDNMGEIKDNLSDVKNTVNVHETRLTVLEKEGK